MLICRNICRPTEVRTYLEYEHTFTFTQKYTVKLNWHCIQKPKCISTCTWRYTFKLTEVYNPKNDTNTRTNENTHIFFQMTRRVLLTNMHLDRVLLLAVICVRWIRAHTAVSFAYIGWLILRYVRVCVVCMCVCLCASARACWARVRTGSKRGRRCKWVRAENITYVRKHLDRFE